MKYCHYLDFTTIYAASKKCILSKILFWNAIPSFSPDYNPIEMLWKKVKQAGTHLQYFPTFDSLVIKVEEMLELFSDVKNEVLSLFGFYDNLCCE
jgi:hypothetical protein